MIDPRNPVKSTTALIVLTAAASSVLAKQVPAMDITSKSQVVVVLPVNSTPAEKTAAEELQHYLPEVTKAQVSIATESKAVFAKNNQVIISVGNTEMAKSAGIKAGSFTMDEWLMRLNNKTLYLIGHGTRGTLYATYHFLEDKAGVRWWTPWEEFVPQKKSLSLSGLNKKGKPVFDYRDIYSVYGNDGGRFAIRNRLNRDGDTPIAAKYGGGRDYGPPYHVHTFYAILDPKKNNYYKDHPEWFLGNGDAEPNDHNSQLAMSNPAMRQEFLKLLLEIIRTSRIKAVANNLPAPDVFNVSQADNMVSFKGPGDEKILAENGGAESAILLDFINFLADNVKEEFPDVFIDTLAYHSGEKAPTKIRPRDNVTIRLTDTKSNLVAPVTAPENHDFHDNIVNWGKITKNLRVWDYAISYVYPGLPTPTIQTYAPDLRFWAEHNVKGIFVEHEYEVRADMRDLKIWLQCKLFEDPYANPDELVKEFTDGYYGAAGPYVRRYLTLLEESSRKSRTHLSWFASPGAHTHISVGFIGQANEIFDQASKAVAGNKALERRVAHARLPLDRSVLARYEILTRKWGLDGNSPETFPLDKNVFLNRYERTWAEQIDFRMPEKLKTAESDFAKKEIAKYRSHPTFVKVPEKFKAVPAKDIHVFAAHRTRNHLDWAKVVADSGIENGFATRYEIPDHEVEKYKLPMPWGLYDTAKAIQAENTTISTDEVPGPGYHWYRIPDAKVSNGDYLYFFYSWIIQVDVDEVFDLKNPDQKFDVWAQLKFEGPAFPHGKATDKNAITVGNVVVVKK